MGMEFVESLENVLDTMETFSKTGSVTAEELRQVFTDYMQNTAEYKEKNARILAERGRIFANETGGSSIIIS
jgi:hypothetical protein